MGQLLTILMGERSIPAMQLKVGAADDGGGAAAADDDGGGGGGAAADDSDGGGGGHYQQPRHKRAGAWFILSEALHRKSPSLQQLGLNMLDWMWKRGWDDQHGGLFYFRWPSRAASVSCIRAYRVAPWCRDIHGKPVQE
jgi:hypothetical protein